MNRLSKILIAIIVILVIALIIISSEYVKMRKSAIKNLNLYFEAEARYIELKNGDKMNFKSMDILKRYSMLLLYNEFLLQKNSNNIC